MTCFPLLADSLNRLESMGSRFRESSSSIQITSLIAVIAVFGVTAAFVWQAARWYARWTTRVVNDPRALFRELCRAHRLDRADRHLLLDMAEWHELSDPVQLFLDPKRFQTAEMHAALDCTAAAVELHAHLFAEPEAPERIT